MQEKVELANTTDYKYFLYNSQGVVGFVQNGTTYMYRKNFFGDVTAIYRGTTKVAEYAYDAWGNCTIVSDTNGIGTANPFRYRSYFWDNDLQLYYLMSRYYDPQVGRFLNADGLEYLDPETLGGLNLYAYCLNNPVIYTDSLGTSVILTCLIIGLIIGAVVGGTIGGIQAYNDATDSGATGWELVGQTALGALTGAVIGGTIGAAIGATVGYVAPAISGFLSTSFSFTLPSLGALFGSSGAAAGILITVTGAQILQGIGAIAIGLYFFSEHTKNKRPSTKGKHQKGQSQRQREQPGGEKGDARRPYRKWKRGRKLMFLAPLIEILYEIFYPEDD